MSLHLELILAQVCFASMAVVGRIAMVPVGKQGLPPNAIVLARIAGGALAFWLLARRRELGLSRRDLLRLVACAVTGVIVNQYLFLNGLARSTATNASVLGTTIPVFASLFAIAAGVERFRPVRALGIALGITGILVLVRVENFSMRDDHTAGNLMILVNAASYALFLVLVRPLAARVAPMTLMAVLFSLATAIALPISLPSWIELAPRLGWREAALLLYFVAIPTVGAYALTQRAIERAESSLVASYIYLQPLFATAAAIVLLDERPGLRTFLAAALILGGLLLSTRDGGRIPAQR